LDGQFQSLIADTTPAIAASGDGKFLYAKRLERGLTKFAADGTIVWHAEVPTGRAATRPLELGEHVIVVSDLGLLSVLRTSDGHLVTSHSVSPQLYCLSGIGTDGQRCLATANMDGQLTCLVRS
jgi:hypothetical protein